MQIKGVRRPPVLTKDEIGEVAVPQSRESLPVGTVGYIWAYGRYRRAEVTGHVGRVRLQVTYRRSASATDQPDTRVIPPRQLVVTPDCEIVNRVRRLLPHTVPGPDYIRAVRDPLATALRMFEDPRRRDEGLYWLLEAEISWAVATRRLSRSQVPAIRRAGRLLVAPTSAPDPSGNSSA